MKYNSLLVYYFMFFLMNGFSTFVPKYYGEIGLTDGMIGILTSIPTIVAVACSPMIAVLTDRVPKKRYMLTVLLALLSDAALCARYGQEEGIGAIAAAAGCTEDEVRSAVAFWRGAGVISLGEGKKKK